MGKVGVLGLSPMCHMTDNLSFSRNLTFILNYFPLSLPYKTNIMKKRIYEILSTITKRKDNYGDGVSLRFKDKEGNTIGVVRYGVHNGNYIMTNGEIYDLMEVLNNEMDFKEGDVYDVDKIIKDYCYEYIKQ